MPEASRDRSSGTFGKNMTRSITVPTIPSLISSQLRETAQSLREMHERLAAQAPKIESAIRMMDTEVARALHEDDDMSPLGRLIAYRTTLWAQHGWFPSTWDTPLELISRTAEVLGTAKHEMAERAIATHFDRDRQKHIDCVINSHPTRNAILSDALAAHDEGRFALSIPVFLTQADGIGAGFFEIDSIYTTSESNFAKIKAKYDREKKIFKIRYLHFLVATLTPLNASRGRRQKYQTPFNRHTVIHGESIDYPTRINSLKSISWLGFVADLVKPEQ